ncbi:MAG: bifunctional D-glycero-beta-D-manno-heptose-7-phosphate kinase/D-glycero-beta-D-manno-heptose 1-phosphate adenylyltransferase HldE [Gammaproteobacteria bacterium]
MSLAAFRSASVVVVGDVILDRYWSGVTTRISPEAPVPVVRVTAAEERPGGAGNVAVNVTNLGGQATLIGITGGDEAAHRLRRLLEAHGVVCRLAERSGYTTVTKLRVLSRHQQLIRLDFEDHATHLDTAALYEESAAGAIEQAGAVILSDYAKGALAQAEPIIRLARAADRPVIVDPKGSDFARYRGATLMTPNLKEFQTVVGACRDLRQIEERARQLCADIELSAVLVTRGERGMALVPAEGAALHLPAEAREVYDVTGAGDTVVAVIGTALAAGFRLEQAVALANTAAGLVVAKLGAASVTGAELEAALSGPGPDEARAVVDEPGLVELAAKARARGEQIVMTNGCFDVLHAGHVRYLSEARGLGDRLIVAVNDDGSVRRLKGAGRPVNSLAKRMEVLAALRAVDWVVPFVEDTPLRLITRIRPEVLVKGGDYRADAVVGADVVREAGGKVVILSYHPGCSSSQLIAAL